ncbi:MAG: hypothetical protein ACPHY7_00490 [Gammaproteobacteria bacterium]
MEIIVFQNEIYTLYPINYNFDFLKWDFYDYCDIVREALSTFDDEINRWVMNNGSGIWFGCIGR